jgi:hypothetical protein
MINHDSNTQANLLAAPKQTCLSAFQDLPATRATLLVIGADWHRLQRWLDQAECDAEVVQPVLQFLFHGAPLG